MEVGEVQDLVVYDIWIKISLPGDSGLHTNHQYLYLILQH